MGRKVEVPRYFLREMPDIVRGGRAKSGVEFVGRGKPARCIGRLKHEHALTAARQISSADQAIMSTANDDRVVSIQSCVPSVVGQAQTLVTAGPQDFRAYTLKVWQKR